MSDDGLKLVPKDPAFGPTPAAQAAAVTAPEQLLPEGEMCQAEVRNCLWFIDQGENLEAVVCPYCGGRTTFDFHSEDDPALDWRYELSDKFEDEETNLSDLLTEMPSCSHQVKVMDIEFDWPAAFARFELSICNPNVSENLATDQLGQLESLLGCELKQVRAHY